METEQRIENLIQKIEYLAITIPNYNSILSDNHVITFNEMNRASNRIANYLIGKGLKGSILGIYMNRTSDVVVTILGIMKAGSAYVFLDPNYPPERLGYIVENSEIKIVFYRGILHKSLKWIHVSFVNIHEDTIQNCSSDNPELKIKGDSRAYVMYTSGSTGNPKGVEITHANLVSYLKAIKSVLDIKPDDIYLHTASFSFSSSIRQYCLPLFSGIPLYIAKEDEVVSLYRLLKLIKEYRLTVFDSTQSLWKYGIRQIERLIPEERQTLINSDLRMLVLSGEMLPTELVHKISGLYSKRLAIVNVCGQTESIGGMAYPLPDNFNQDSGIVPIGYPLPNTAIYVFNEDMKPAKDGEIGEMYLSSPSVGLGYMNNPELTRETFIEKSKVNGRSERLLKTGDLVRYWENKPIEIIGRTDFQVKIRGIRINLTEVETVIRKSRYVNDCVIVGVKNHLDETVIVGFVLLEDKNQFSPKDIKDNIKRILPGAYVPERIVSLEKIPLTPNGKIDRILLQEMAELELNGSQPHAEIEYRNEIQKTLYNLFVKVLDNRNIELNDSFFDVGGQSLKAIELVELMERIFNTKIPVELLYRYPSIARLATVVSSLHIQSDPINLLAIQPYGTTLPFICVHGDDANFFLPKYFGEVIPFYGYFHQGRNGDRMRHTSIEAIARSYTEELYKLRPKGPYILGGFSIGGVIAFSMIDQIRKRGEEVSLLVIIDSESPQYKGSRILGSKTFLAETEIDSSVKFTLPTGLLKGLFISKVKEILFHYGYPISRLLARFNIRIPQFMRNSYIMGVYRRARTIYQSNPVNIDALIIRSTIDNLEDFDLGWSRYILGKLDIYEINSDHLTIIKEPHVRKLADIVRKAILEKSLHV